MSYSTASNACLVSTAAASTHTMEELAAADSLLALAVTRPAVAASASIRTQSQAAGGQTIEQKADLLLDAAGRDASDDDDEVLGGADQGGSDGDDQGSDEQEDSKSGERASSDMTDDFAWQPWTGPGNYPVPSGGQRRFNSRRAYNQYQRRHQGVLKRGSTKERVYTSENDSWIRQMLQLSSRIRMTELAVEFNLAFPPGPGQQPRTAASIRSHVTRNELRTG